MTGDEPFLADDGDVGFDPDNVEKSTVAIPLLQSLDDDPAARHPVVIDLNLVHPGGLDHARETVHEAIIDATDADPAEIVNELKGEYTPQYLYAELTRDEIVRIVQRDNRREQKTIYKIWPDFEVRPLLNESVATVKADAARIAFSALGTGITWAVADTGIDGTHPHFALHDNVAVDLPVSHMDFSANKTRAVELPTDPNGHGTHVAGIIAGEVRPDDGDQPIWAGESRRTEENTTEHRRNQVHTPIAGVASRARLVSLRVLDDYGNGRVSNLLAAVGYILRVNDFGRWNRINGVNMSVGYGFDPEWFACGQSPLCVEVDRLVRSGVSVVVAAGNTGYWRRGGQVSPLNAGISQTINDPGNARLAITVGSTHRSEPHVYGVSYFSSKGPTGDGRLKPDLVAPGERVLSCASGAGASTIAAKTSGPIHYRQWSGTSMAAPHVSGAIAAFLSIRREFIGQPERIKKIFLSSATDLGRERYFQGYGLVDLMRAIQSV